MKKEQILYEMYKDNIIWSSTYKCWTIDFQHQEQRIRRRSKKWIKSKKWLAEDELKAICIKLSKDFVIFDKTIDDVFQEYMQFKNVRESTKDVDRRTYTNLVLPIFDCQKKIAETKELDIAVFRNKLSELKKPSGEYYDNKTLRMADSIVKQIFNYAEDFRYIEYNVVRRSPQFKTSRPESDFKRRYTDFKNVLKVLDALEQPKYRAALAISLYTFMRPAEIFGLDFKDDLGDKLYHRQTWNSVKKVMGPPKNGKRRYVAIPKLLRKELDRYYESLKGSGYLPDSPLIGVTKRQSKSSIDKAIATGIKTANVPHFLWYDLRSTMITNALRSGADPYVVAKNAGHSQTMTTDTYAIVDIEEQQQFVENMYKNLMKKAKKRWRYGDDNLENHAFIDNYQSILKLNIIQCLLYFKQHS